MQMQPFLRACLGLNTKVDPVRLQYNPETGVQFLAEAVNIDIDPTGRISRRKGLRSISELASPHSLWSTRDESVAYVISGSTLYQLFEDGTVSALTTGLTVDAKGYFTEVGQDVYFSNGYEMGVLKSRVNWEVWAKGTYTGPTTDRTFIGPSPGSHLFHYRSRIYYAIQNFLIYSEPFNYGLFDPTRNFIPVPGSSILMTAALSRGFYVSSDKGVYFVSGPTPNEFEFSFALPHPAVPGRTVVHMPAEQVIEGAQGEAILFVAQNSGFCLGLEGGSIVRLLDDRIDIPLASSGHAVLNKANMQYLTFLEV